MAYEIFQSEKSKKFYFRLKAKNNQVILASEAYNTKKNAENGIASVKKHAAPKNFETKEAKDGRTYFVLKAKNGEVIGTSQMYKSKSGLRNGMNSVCNNCKSEIKDKVGA